MAKIQPKKVSRDFMVSLRQHLSSVYSAALESSQVIAENDKTRYFSYMRDHHGANWQDLDFPDDPLAQALKKQFFASTVRYYRDLSNSAEKQIAKEGNHEDQ